VFNLIGVGNTKNFIINFFTKLGIAHRVSCHHTHQQNGSAEQNHRHIVETGFTLLAHAGMPLKFGNEAFMTATFLINHLPTRVIDNLSPMERLLKIPPNYSMLRIFGFACWPHLRPYNKHKLEFCSKPCAILGYSSLHKGYKCLDMETGQVYISWDVVFDEVVFPFSTPSSNFVEQPGDSSTNVNNNHLQHLLPVGFLLADHSYAKDPTAGDTDASPLAPCNTQESCSTAAANTAMPLCLGSSLADSPVQINYDADDIPSDDSDTTDNHSSTDSVEDFVGPTVLVATGDQHPYGTRLKNNIRQPKKRTDGTITYSVS
jgi:hypothetical protein